MCSKFSTSGRITILLGKQQAETGERVSPRKLAERTGVPKDFIYRLDSGQARHIDLDALARHRTVFESVLALTSFNLLHDDYHRIFQVISEYSYSCARYKLDESSMIVVLRKLYEDKTEHISLASDPVVTIGEVREEYRTITGKERDLGMGQYETLLRRLRSIGLIETIDGRTIDVRDAEARLRLRGSVRLILPIQSATEMEAWLRKYRAGDVEGENDEE